MKLVVLASGPDNVNRLVGDLRENFRLQPVIWLGKPSLDAWVRERVPNCLVLSYSQLESGELLVQQKFSRAAVSLADAFLTAQTNPFKKDALLAEFSRFNWWRFLRPLDREIALRQLTLFLGQELLMREPEALFSSETPHNPFALVLFELAQFLGLKTLFFQPVTALAPALVPMTSLDEFFKMKARPINNQEASDFVREIAEESVVELREGKSTRLQRHLEGRSGSNLSRTVQNNLLRYVERLRRWGKLGFSRELLNFVFNVRASTDLARAYKHLQDIPSTGKHALFALHYQPERTTVPEGGYRWSLQADAVLAARALLPENLHLAVKEHGGQVAAGRRGYMARNPGYYELIKALPRTELLSGDIPASNHIESALVIFTLTGSIGIEGVLRGIPVVHFGYPWWSGVPGSIPFSSIRDFAQAYNGLRADMELGTPGSFLIKRVAEDCIPGFGSPSQEFFWRKHLSIPDQFDTWATDSLLAVIEQRFYVP